MNDGRHLGTEKDDYELNKLTKFSPAWEALTGMRPLADAEANFPVEKISQPDRETSAQKLWEHVHLSRKTAALSTRASRKGEDPELVVD